MNRDLLAAEAHLRHARDRWPDAAHNLHGHTTPSSAGLLDGGMAGGYPTGHTATARIDDGPDRWDPVLTALRNIHHDLTTCAQLALELLDCEPPRYHDGPTLHRLHSTLRLVQLATHLDLATTALDDARTIHHHAGRTRQTIIDWAWTQPTREQLPGCRDCARIGWWNPPTNGQLCRWCYDFHRAYRRTPPRHLLELNRDGIRITSRHINTALRKKTA